MKNQLDELGKIKKALKQAQKNIITLDQNFDGSLESLNSICCYLKSKFPDDFIEDNEGDFEIRQTEQKKISRPELEINKINYIG